MTEPKNDPVRVALPPRPDKAPPSGKGAKHPGVRIVLPTQTPAAPVRLVPPRITPLAAVPESRAAVPTESRPKNETVRISTLTPPPLAVVVTSSLPDPFDAIRPTLRWALVGTASVNFLIQIWIYVVS